MKSNIIVILAEDICPNWGCYGDLNAKTPNLDAFAKENIRFNHCYSAGPVCSAARSSLNLGMYGSSAGVGQHRSMNGLPKEIKNIGYYMQQAGYYTAIGKTDFNYPLSEGYDEIMHYDTEDTPEFAKNIIKTIRHAPENKPVFMIQTSAITHQSQYGYTQDIKEHRRSMPRLKENEQQIRSGVQVPGYHFTSQESKEIWAQYHEKMTSMDRMVGEAIDALKKHNLFDDTFLFIAGDNGHGIPEGKINLWDEGVHVPLLLHVPDKYRDEIPCNRDENGDYCNRMVNFVDFAPTFLSIANAKIPEHMQGIPFLGSQRREPSDSNFSFGERCDEMFENSRTVHKGEYMYSLDVGWSKCKRVGAYQITQAPWFVYSMIEEGYKANIKDEDRRALFRKMPRVEEQLYNLKTDKNQLKNLSESSEFQQQKYYFRDLTFQYIMKFHDGVFMPEPLARELEKKSGLCVYEILRQKDLYPLNTLIELWKEYLEGKNMTRWYQKELLSSPEKMLLIKIAMVHKEYQLYLKEYLADSSEVVRAYAAYVLNEKCLLVSICKQTNNYVLLIFIADLIFTWENADAKECFYALLDRCVDSSIKIDSRFESAMYSTIQLLAAKLEIQIADFNKDVLWSIDKIKNSTMVVEAMDKEER